MFPRLVKRCDEAEGVNVSYIFERFGSCSTYSPVRYVSGGGSTGVASIVWIFGKIWDQYWWIKLINTQTNILMLISENVKMQKCKSWV